MAQPALVDRAVAATVPLLQVILRVLRELQGRGLLAALGRAVPLTLTYSVEAGAEALVQLVTPVLALARLAAQVWLLLLQELQLHALAVVGAVSELVVLVQVQVALVEAAMVVRRLTALRAPLILGAVAVALVVAAHSVQAAQVVPA